jgi:hypothetical protein
MAIIVTTENPAGLLAAIRKAIDGGHVTTWSYDADGDFTHTPSQWAYRAWLRPSIGSGKLLFGIVASTKFILSDEVYGIYHGRYIEMLLAHFSDKFGNASATAQFLKPPDVA